MSGKDASRGFYYQALASILNALTEENNWDKIYIEPINNDKVDIELKKEDKLVKCIQVKSSINLFEETMIKKWLTELMNSVKSPIYELFLIGQCNKSANNFINSIKKFYSQTPLTKKDQLALEDFDTKNKIIKIIVLPFDLEILEANVKNSLHKYISSKIIESINFEQLSLIFSNIIDDFLKSSTGNDGITKNNFDENIKKIIIENFKNLSPKRIPIKIRSFIHPNENKEELKKENENENTLFLVEDFNGRKLKENLDWNKDISEKVINFLKEKTNKEYTYEISLISHLSIAFLAGRQLNSKSGINIFPIQNENILWDIDLDIKKEQNYSKWNTNFEILNPNFCDCALILNANHCIYEDVKKYINNFKLPIGKAINCSLEEISGHSIKNGTHAYLLANSINDYIKKRNIEERQAVLHIFVAVPNGFMFFLGQNSNGFGKCILYEYDFEQKDSCTYSPSMKFID